MSNDTQNPQDEEGTEEVEFVVPIEASYNPYVMPSIIRKDQDSEQSVPLWLITFTDVMALMLTFFVLLYAMSSPKQDKWDSLTQSLGNQFDKQYSKPFAGGSQDTINIDRIPTTKALDLKYLKTLVAEHIKQEGLKDVAVNQQPKRLVISLPSSLVFGDGTAQITPESKVAIYALGGILSRIKNRIEVIGHTDPRPFTGGKDAPFQSNWDLSLARSVSVAALLKEAGYGRDITVRGLSSGRFEELPETIIEEERLALARRVDIIIMQDTIEQNKYFDMP